MTLLLKYPIYRPHREYTANSSKNDTYLKCYTEMKFLFVRFLLWNNKVWTSLENIANLFFVYGKGKLLFSCSKLAGWAQNWWPSWPGQNGVVMSLVVLLSCHAENLEWLWEKRLVFKAPQNIFVFSFLVCFFKLVHRHFHGLGLFIPKKITPRKMLSGWSTE